MGRKRTANHDLPPRMHRKGEAYYHVTSTTPRKWTCLGSSLPQAKLKWAELGMAGSDERNFEALADRYMAECMADKSDSWQRDSRNRAAVLVKRLFLCFLALSQPHRNRSSYTSKTSKPRLSRWNWQGCCCCQCAAYPSPG